MKKLAIVIIGLCLIMITFSGIKLNQAYSLLPTIYYDAQKKEFEYFNANNKDLFINLKEIMPGDVREQEILFKVENIKTTLKLFLKLNGEKNISDYVKIKTYVDDKEIINNSEYLELGSFTKDVEFKLKVIVEVSKEVGNEIEDLKHNMSWEILVQHENEEAIKVPYTYDDSHILLYIIIMVVSLIIMSYALIEILKTHKSKK